MEIAQELRGFEENMNWLNKHYEKLKRQYPDKYVAVFDKKVVDHDSDLNTLMRRLDTNYAKESNRIAVKYVTTKKIELIL